MTSLLAVKTTMQVTSLLAAQENYYASDIIISRYQHWKTTMQVTSLLAALENYYASDIIISSTGKLLCK